MDPKPEQAFMCNGVCEARGLSDDGQVDARVVLHELTDAADTRFLVGRGGEHHGAPRFGRQCLKEAQRLQHRNQRSLGVACTAAMDAPTATDRARLSRA